MDGDGPTRAEWDRLYSTMEAGFAGTHARLDTLNGRVGRGEIELAVVTSRLAATERQADEIAAMLKNRARGSIPVSKRDSAIAAGGIAVIIALLEVIRYLGEHLWSVMRMGRL